MSAPAAKIRSPAPHDHRARRVVGELAGRRFELAQQGDGEGVGLGPVEADQGDAVVAAFDRDERVGHDRTLQAEFFEQLVRRRVRVD